MLSLTLINQKSFIRKSSPLAVGGCAEGGEGNDSPPFANSSNKTVHEALSTLKVADLLSSEDVVHLGL